MRPTRVAVSGSIRLYRDGVARFLAEAGFEIAGTPDTADACLAVAASARPDIVLIDLAMPRATDCIRGLSEVEGVAAVAVGVHDHDAAIVAAAEIGVAGFVTREESLDHLVAVVTSAARGELACSPRVAAVLLRRVATLAAVNGAWVERPQLTPREREIVRLLERGLSNKEIASLLHIAVATVKNHVHNALEKLGVHNRRDAPSALRRSEVVAPVPEN